MRKYKKEKKGGYRQIKREKYAVKKALKGREVGKGGLIKSNFISPK